jgi:polyisoprenoid-binding protein YceI
MAPATAGRVAVPTWKLDPAHSSIEFSVKHMMMTTVRGRFKEVQSTLTGDRDHPEAAGVEVTIAVASIDTGVGDRDAHLRGPDFFDAERFPQITFRSTRIEGNPPKQEGDRFRLAGDLVIHGTEVEPGNRDRRRAGREQGPRRRGGAVRQAGRVACRRVRL